MLRDLIEKTRTYRRFHEDVPVSMDVLRDLIDLARIGASAANLQPLKYILVNTPQQNARVFETLAWAGYLTDWPGPEPGERPAAYVVILGDTTIAKKFDVDPGIAAQNILLGAVEKGLGGCMFGSVKRDQLRASFQIPGHLEILYAIALGKPRETVVLEPLRADGSIRYYRDRKGVHHVPKRALDEIIVNP